MRDTQKRESRSRRPLFSGAAVGAVAALLLSGMATPALAAEGETVTGTPYSDTEAYMSVTPGTELDPDGTTTVTLQGHNYDATRPVYVGLGTNLSPDSPEQWRRSQGGFSGPDGDYDYGVPRLVVANGSSDGDVADSEMDPDGNWTLSVDVPGSAVASFFGGEIDCLAGSGCGFFSFGAHGQVTAANEAYVGIEFAEPGQAVAPEFTSQPESVTVDEGADATFSADATGDPAPGYQWQSAAAGSDAFSDIEGATEASYTVSGVQASDDGARFRVVAANEAGEAVSNSATLTVDTGEEPEPDGNSATGVGHNYDPEKQDQPSLTVTWPEGGLPTDEPSTATLTGEDYATSSDAGTTFGGAYTLFGVIELREEEDPGSWAPSKRGVSGVHYDYMGEAGTYQQMVNYPGNTTEPGMPYMDEDGDWTLEDHPVPGARFTSQSGQQIDCLAEGTQCGFITVGAHGQRSAGVEVFTPVEFAGEAEGIAPEITSQPESVTVDEGADATFEVVATGDPAPAYQWQSAAAGSDEFADIEGASEASHVVSGAQAADSGTQFRVVVTNEAGEAVSNAATLTVNAAEAEETATTAVAQATGEYPTDFAGEDVAVSATVTPAEAAGSVEFFAGGESLGSAEVEDGTATLTTDVFTGGAHQVRAAFSPADAAAFAPSESAERTYRIVDLEPAVSAIEVGDAARQITDAELSWSIANFVSFNAGPGKEVLGGDVELAELPEAPTVEDRANQEFVFSNGTGVEDADGNRIIEFDGEVRLTSGTAPEWNFREPQVHVNAAGNGYITAVVDGIWRGSLLGGEDVPYGPERVVVQTFTDAQPGTVEGETAFTVAPLFEGQVAAGTWSGDYTGATLTNQFLQHVNSNVRSYFLQSGASADATKAGKPLTVSFESGVAPEVSISDDVSVVEGEDALFTASASGDPDPSLQWQKRAGDAWEDIAGATGEELSLAEVAADDAGEYRVTAENAFGSAESGAATLEVQALESAAIVSGPEDQAVTEGEDAVFEVEATGVPAPAYQWQMLAPGSGDDTEGEPEDEIGSRLDEAAWADIEGATDASYTAPGVSLDQDGTQFRVVVSNGVGDPVVSDAASLTVAEDRDPGDGPGEEPGENPGEENPGGEVPGDQSPGGQNPGNGDGNGDDGQGGLASTGSTLPLIAAGVAALLLLSGAVLVARRRGGVSAE